MNDSAGALTLLAVLAWAGVALAGAVVGALAALARDRPPRRWVGWANALAAGMMLGIGYVLALAALDRGALVAGCSAVGGVLASHLAALAVGPGEVRIGRVQPAGAGSGYRVMLAATVHGAWEGVAIGAAMGVSLGAGSFTALAIAGQNAPEAGVLCAVLRGQGARPREAVILAVASNLGQVATALVTFAVVARWPGALGMALGLAVGGLVHLVMVELLPEAYRRAGHVSIALVTCVAMGAVALLGGP